MRQPERIVLVIGVAILAIIAISAGAALAFGSPEVAEFATDSPEGVLQRYLEAARDNDVPTMESLLSEQVRDQPSKDEFGPGYCNEIEDRIVTVERVSIDGDTAVVFLNIEQFDDSLFDSGGSVWQQEARLVREADEWKINDAFFCV